MNIDFGMLTKSIFNVNYISQKDYYYSKEFLNKEVFLRVYLSCFSLEKLPLITKGIELLLLNSRE